MELQQRKHPLSIKFTQTSILASEILSCFPASKKVEEQQRDPKIIDQKRKKIQKHKKTHQTPQFKPREVAKVQPVEENCTVIFEELYGGRLGFGDIADEHDKYMTVFESLEPIITAYREAMERCIVNYKVSICLEIKASLQTTTMVEKEGKSGLDIELLHRVYQKFKEITHKNEQVFLFLRVLSMSNPALDELDILKKSKSIHEEFFRGLKADNNVLLNYAAEIENEMQNYAEINPELHGQMKYIVQRIASKKKPKKPKKKNVQKQEQEADDARMEVNYSQLLKDVQGLGSYEYQVPIAMKSQYLNLVFSKL